MKKVAVFLILLTVWCSGCVRDDLAECPPLQIMVEVIDKNYENIADAEALGMDVRKAEGAISELCKFAVLCGYRYGREGSERAGQFSY